MITRRALTAALGCLLLSRTAFAQSAPPAGKPGKRRMRDMPYTPLEQIPNHREYMRDIVITLAAYGKQRNSSFLAMVRNGPELLIKEKREYNWETARDPDGATDKYLPVGSVIRPYLEAIDGMLIDGLFCGRDAIDQTTDASVTRDLLNAAGVLRKEGRQVFSIEYCPTAATRAAVAKKAREAHILSYLAPDPDKRLARLPHEHPAEENPRPVTDLADVRNFLPMMHSDRFGSRDEWVAALGATNYDMLLLDPFWRDSEALTAADVKSLRYKALGMPRLVLATLPIGRATDTRFYWKREWRPGNPAWLVAPDLIEPSQMIVRYWSAEWKDIIGKYMQGLVDLGFDGVVFDTAEAYLYFEDLMPIN